MKYSAGVIDSSYRGEIFIALSNINNMDPNKLTPAIGQDTIVSIAQDKSEKE